MYENVTSYEKRTRYRSEFEILKDILRATYSRGFEGVKKTHLMYMANLNSRQLERHLNLLVDLRLIAKTDNSRYKITNRGIAVLALISYLVKIIRGENDPVIAFHGEILNILDGLNLKYDINVVRYGDSGLQHNFDILTKVDDDDIAICIGIGESDDVLFNLMVFLVSLFDTRIKGVFITNREIKNIDGIKENVIILKCNSIRELRYELPAALLKLTVNQTKH